MKNDEFLSVIKKSFTAYLEVGTSRSPAKLKSLYEHIAVDLQKMLGDEFSVMAQGSGIDKGNSIIGRYYPKSINITINKNNKVVAGYSVRFVMRNYSQNSNNYFENMLGETANIRSNSIPYFQVLIVFEKVPYYEAGGNFKKYDVVTSHNLDKYLALSKDDPSIFYHTPDKTLIILIHLKEKSPDYQFKNSNDYADYYRSVINDNDLMSYSTKIADTFDNSVIYNNYEDFIKRTGYIILGKIKK